MTPEPNEAINELANQYASLSIEDRRVFRGILAWIDGYAMPKPRVGRPAGSKNRVKAEAPQASAPLLRALDRLEDMGLGTTKEIA